MDKPRKTKKSKKSKRAKKASGLPASVKGLLKYMEGSSTVISRTPRSTPSSQGQQEATNINIKLKIGALPQAKVVSALATATAPLVAQRQAVPVVTPASVDVGDITRKLNEETITRQKLELGVLERSQSVQQQLQLGFQEMSGIKREITKERGFTNLLLQQQFGSKPQTAEQVRREVAEPEEIIEERPVIEPEEQRKYTTRVKSEPVSRTGSASIPVRLEGSSEQVTRILIGSSTSGGETTETDEPQTLGSMKYEAPTGKIVLKDLPKKKVRLVRKQKEEPMGGGASARPEFSGISSEAKVSASELRARLASLGGVSPKSIKFQKGKGKQTAIARVGAEVERLKAQGLSGAELMDQIKQKHGEVIV